MADEDIQTVPRTPVSERIALRTVPVQELNRLVMATEDLKLLSAWLDEEKVDARRVSAMLRIFHRLNMLRGRAEREALRRIGEG